LVHLIKIEIVLLLMETSLLRIHLKTDNAGLEAGAKLEILNRPKKAKTKAM
jgi:hypothetical protein